MLNMKVLDYQITSKDSQVTVTRTRLNDENKEIVQTVGFYPNLDMALRGIQSNYTLSEGTDIQTIQDYRKALNEVSEAFRIELGLERIR